MRKFTFIIMICLLLLTQAGCQLAEPESGSNAVPDKLIGVLVTIEPLDMMDSEYTEPVSVTLTEADLIRLSSGSVEEALFATEFPERRYYAELVEESSVDAETGKVHTRMHYSFDHLGGWALMTPSMSDENGEYIASDSSDEMCEVQTHIKGLEDEAGQVNELILSGTLYHVIGSDLPAGEDLIFELNAIYQTAEGAVYATPGNSYGFNVSRTSEGVNFTMTLDDEHKLQTGRRTETNRTSASISIAGMFRPVGIILLQMDADGNVLAKEEFEPGQMPETMTPEEDTAFLIVQTIKLDSSGTEITSAELVDQTASSVQTFCAAPDGICRPQTTQISWP